MRDPFHLPLFAKPADWERWLLRGMAAREWVARRWAAVRAALARAGGRD